MKSAAQRRCGSLARPRFFSELRRSTSADGLLLGSLRRHIMYSCKIITCVAILLVHYACDVSDMSSQCT